MAFSDVWRVLNAVIAAVAALLIIRDMFTKWRHRKPRTRLLSMALLGLLLVVVEGSIENLMLDNPPGLRTGLTTMAVIWVLMAKLLTPEDEFFDVSRETEEQ